MTDPVRIAAGRDRSGHLSGLAFDRYRYDPTATASYRADVEAHLTDCATCRAALQALETQDAALVVAPPSPLRLVHAAASAPSAPAHGRPGSDRARRLLPWFASAGAVLALAAIAFFATRGDVTNGGLGFDPDPHGVRAKGGRFDFEVWLEQGGHTHPVRSGDRVRPGDRFGFRVHARTDGWLLIAGIDAANQLYPCYPEPPANTPTASVSAAAFTRTETPRALELGMRFDDLLGEERLLAFFCEAPLGFDALPKTAASPLVAPPGCELEVVTLTKVAR
jgi:hypothetical protein